MKTIPEAITTVAERSCDKNSPIMQSYEELFKESEILMYAMVLADSSDGVNIKIR